MNGSKGAISTSIKLTEEQRGELAKTLGIDVKFVPTALGVVGVPKGDIATLGLPDSTHARFSPALIMM